MQERIDAVTRRNTTNKPQPTQKRSGSVKKRNNKAISAKRASNLRAIRAPKVINIKKKDKKPFPWSIIFVAALFTSLFLFMMMNYAEVDKYRSEIAQLDSRIATMEKTQDDLAVTYSNKYDLAEVEKYAQEELGMTKSIPQENIHVITIEQGDKTEMHSYDDGEEGGFGFLLTGFAEVITDFVDEN